ncbi:MAG: acyl-CoA dehydrogenase family protein, partial [Archangium sp.]|nr:acyl-CoA dehydrogenase family protein [Archangium sp.]
MTHSTYQLSPELSAQRARVRDFVDRLVIPAERDIVREDRAGGRDTLRSLQTQARAEGLWTPHVPQAWGGHGLGPMGMCALFREMGRSPFGAKVFNCDAPDQGNMDLLLSVASDAQREQFLRPLANGEITSAFCMTEPAPGAGADPSNLATRATRVDGGWELTGHKWYSTGARNAAFFIVMARTSDDAQAGATLFLVEKKDSGVTYVRDVPTMGEQLLDHHEGEVRFERVRLSDDAVLGGVGNGFRLAQARLVPARLTHCMRWLGLASRTLDL